MRDVTYVGFVSTAAVPYVFFDTSEPTRPQLQRHSDTHYSVHLPSARLQRGVLALPLELQCMPGPFSQVVAEPQEEPATGVALQLFLRAPAAIRLQRHHLRWTVMAQPLPHPSRRPKHRHGTAAGGRR